MLRYSFNCHLYRGFATFLQCRRLYWWETDKTTYMSTSKSAAELKPVCNLHWENEKLSRCSFCRYLGLNRLKKSSPNVHRLKIVNKNEKPYHKTLNFVRAIIWVQNVENKEETSKQQRDALSPDVLHLVHRQNHQRRDRRQATIGANAEGRKPEVWQDHQIVQKYEWYKVWVEIPSEWKILYTWV